MQRLYDKNQYSNNKYCLARVSVSSIEHKCAIYGYYKDIDYNIRGYSTIFVKEDEVSSLNFYSASKLNNMVRVSKMSIEIAGRDLHVGDLVVGYFKQGGHTRNLCMGLYIGKKQVYTVNGEINCPEVFLIDPNFMLDDEIELFKRLKMLYTTSNEASLMSQSNTTNNAIIPGDIVCTSSKNLYLYLGQYLIDEEYRYIYLNFSVMSVKQSCFFNFLKGKCQVNVSIDSYNYSTARLELSDIKLRGLLFIILGACSGKFLVANKLKSFSTIVSHLNIAEEERCNLKFRKTKDGYMLV